MVGGGGGACEGGAGRVFGGKGGKRRRRVIKGATGVEQTKRKGGGWVVWSVEKREVRECGKKKT